ncbi:ATP-dependent DNA ligase [soil metagenome]
MGFPIDLPVSPMLAKLSRAIPDGEGWSYEPKWDGFRCIVARQGDTVELASRQQRPITRYFPELVPPLLTALPPHVVIDGEIVVPDGEGEGLDFDALLQRIHPAESRVTRLAAETPSVFVAFDVLAVGDVSWLGRPFAERRAELERVVTPGPSVYVTPVSLDRRVADEWFGRFEGAGLDGIVAKGLHDPYQPGQRALVKVKHSRTAECVLAGFRIHKDGHGVGSLLLGLYDDAGDLHHVGVAAAFSVKRRQELLAELTPLTDGAREGHPWGDWAAMQTSLEDVLTGVTAPADARTKPGGGSRWNAGKDMSWIPVRAERVVEVTFGQLEGGRFRHGVSFVRWRPDRTPESCRYDQLDVASPVSFYDVVDESARD